MKRNQKTGMGEEVDGESAKDKLALHQIINVKNKRLNETKFNAYCVRHFFFYRMRNYYYFHLFFLFRSVVVIVNGCAFDMHGSNQCSRSRNFSAFFGSYLHRLRANWQFCSVENTSLLSKSKYTREDNEQL